MKTLALAFLLFAAVLSCEAAPCALEIREKGDGRPVPALMFSSSFALRTVTDNDGVIAIDMPDFFGKDTWFGIHGLGYELKKDFIGNTGFRVKARPGETERREVLRSGRAIALGRLTGSGIFAQSQKLGRRLDYPESGAVCRWGTQYAVVGRHVFWVWNTTRTMSGEEPVYVTGGATKRDDFANPEPPVVPHYAPLAGETALEPLFDEVAGPVEVSGLIVVENAEKKPQLVAVYSRRDARGELLERGLCRMDVRKRHFRILKALWKKGVQGDPSPERFPTGHAVRYEDKDGRKWILFGDPFPTVKVPADYESWNSGGRAWQKVEPPALAASARSGSIAYAPSQKKWFAVYQAREKPGEVYVAKADSPFGPWEDAEKVLDTGVYAFENPLIHAFSLKADSSCLFFEGTPTARNGGKGKRGDIPRVLDNSILYRLDF